MEQEKLDVLYIQEAALLGRHSRTYRRTPATSNSIKLELEIPGGLQVLPRTWRLYEQARRMVYIKSNIRSKVIKNPDYVSDLPVLALTTSKGAEKPTTVCYGYREHTGGVSGLNSLESQAERLQRMLRWVRELEARGDDLLIMGDINLDRQHWNTPDYNLSSLVDQVKVLQTDCALL